MKRKPSAIKTSNIAPDEIREKEIAAEAEAEEATDEKGNDGQKSEPIVEQPTSEPITEQPASEPVSEAEEDIGEAESTEEHEAVADPEVAEELEAVTEPEVEESEVAEEGESDEVPLEASEDESDEILEEEGSLDGAADEVEALATESAEEHVDESADEEVVEAPEVTDEIAEEAHGEEAIGKPLTEEAQAEETVENAIEEAEDVTEEAAEAEEEEAEEIGEAEEKTESDGEAQPEPQAKPEKDGFKLTVPANLEEILANICVKRGRKLIYRPSEILFNCTANVVGTDKANEEGIKVKDILDEEIRQGIKLGYIDKYDGLKMSEIKEEYENDVIYEYAEQEFKRTGLVVDGDKIKVYIYDWDMKALHHVGYVAKENVDEIMPYLNNREKYSFDICGLIIGGKFRKVIKDEASGKVTVEKGNDGKLGIELDISVINRKD